MISQSKPSRYGFVQKQQQKNWNLQVWNLFKIHNKDDGLLYLLLSLKRFHTLVWCLIVEYEQVIVGIF